MNINQIMTEVISTILICAGLYAIGFLIETGRHAARKTLKVCDNCFAIIKRMKG